MACEVPLCFVLCKSRDCKQGPGVGGSHAVEDLGQALSRTRRPKSLELALVVVCPEKVRRRQLASRNMLSKHGIVHELQCQPGGPRYEISAFLAADFGSQLWIASHEPRQEGRSHGPAPVREARIPVQDTKATTRTWVVLQHLTHVTRL